MAIITGIALESNKKFRVNFDGGNLSSDGGLLLLKEFYHKNPDLHTAPSNQVFKPN